ncbi:HEPN domain-containing protein [Moorella sp. E306M]|uniref:HEPN domain-containing protein n=1 Tax=Moorella sp. E306M TaxID=2572683 RepID=UPI0010FFAAE1|nr:HEPN domain-containing protein [Moorella sp. E306M]GEA17538.1 hypothetical protein E306M_06720 [Moorella sp. E306M]
MPYKTKYLDQYKEYMFLYFTDFLQAYRDRVNSYYSEVYAENPEAFPFMKPTLVATIFRNMEIISFLDLSKTAKDEIGLFEDFLESQEEYDRVNHLPQHIQEDRLLKIAGLDSYIERDISWYVLGDDAPPHYDPRTPKYQGSQLADRHYYSFLKKEKKKKLDLYDAEAVIAKVNNDEFKYELEEAIKAYNYGLYLACTATAAVSIETLLKIIVVSRLGENFLPKQIYIISLAEVLKNENIMDDRFFHRLKSFNELRRSAAHSKSGKLDQWDAEQALSLVKLIVETFF